MSIIGRGGTITLTVTYKDATGAAVDPTDPLVDVTDAEGTQLVTAAVPTRVALGLYSYGYVVSPTAPLGTWTATFWGTINGVTVSDDVTFSVVTAGSISEPVTDFTTPDLMAATFGTTWTAGQVTQLETLIALATSTIRHAAGSTITRTTSTVTIPGDVSPRLSVPLSPLVSVEDVSIDGTTVTDFEMVTGALWRASGWAPSGPWRPSNVTLTATHGRIDTPGAIRALTEHLAAAALAQSASAPLLGPQPGLAALQFGDYSETYRTDGPSVSHVLELPEATRRWLATSFGGSMPSVTLR